MRLNDTIRQWFMLALSNSERRRNSRRRLRQHHLAVESLETRELLTTFSVANLNDAGPGSLRDAISQANTNPGADTITFATLGKITLSSGELAITDSVMITGPGADKLAVSGGNSANRIFLIDNSNASLIDVGISNLAIRDGGDGITSTFGAGIRSGENLTLRSVAVTGNNAGDLGGGGIQIFEGNFLMQDSTVANNRAGQGGGLELFGSSATVIDSTISGNQANGHGGGLIALLGPTTVINSTITGNRCDADGTGGGVNGGAAGNVGLLTMHNTIVAGNFQGTGTIPHDAAQLTASSSNNLIGFAGDNVWLTDGVNGNIVGVNGSGNRNVATILNTTLANNGGPTQTHALVLGSLAIDHGSNAAAVDVSQPGSPPLTTDQRGNPVARISNSTVDIGAYELFSLNAPLVVSTNVDELDANISSGDLSLREAIVLANSSPGANTITFAPSTNGTEFDLSLGQMEISETVTIIGNGASRSVIDAQQMSRIFVTTETAGNVTLSDMTVKNGRTSGVGTGFYDTSYAGGAILWLSSGVLTLNRTMFTGNSTLGKRAGGGAILVAHGALIVNESSFYGNSTAGVNSEGGAISAQLGSLLVRNSTLSGNSTTGDYSEGGAVFSLAFDTSMIQSTISGNIASGIDSQGGGLFTQQGNILISQSTITGNNSSISDGGGIFTLSSPINIVNCIVAGNSDSGASSDIRKSPDAADAFLVSNSLIGRNNGTGLVSTQGAVADANGNLIGGTTPQTALNPQLGRLQNNGGPTLTHAILSGSPAIDRGRNAAAIDVTNGNVALTTDQRGVAFARILDGDHLGAAIVDMGAVEFSGLRVTSPNPDAFALRPTFQWTPIAGATSYSIHINNESTGVARFHIATSNSSTYTPSVDLAIGKFKIWIRPNFAAGPGNWSVPYLFNNLTSPTWTTISVTQPTSRPTLIWNGLPRAVRYELWITDISRNVSPIYHNSNVTGTSWTPLSDLPLGRYYVWIRGIAADGTAATWSTRIEFLILQPPTVTQGQNSTFDRTPTFGWNSLSGAVKYEVFVRNQTTGATTLYQKDIVALSFTPTSPLPDGPYRWWAVGISAQNIRSLWTTAIDFYVGGKTSLTAPVGSISSTKPTFQWRPVDGVARYDLFVNRDSGQAQIIRQQNLTGVSFTPTTSLPTGVYRAWIRAFSSSGEAGIWSDFVTFTIAHADSSIDSALNVVMPVSLLSNLTFRLAPESQKRIEEKASPQTDTTDNLIDEFLAES